MLDFERIGLIKFHFLMIGGRGKERYVLSVITKCFTKLTKSSGNASYLFIKWDIVQARFDINSNSERRLMALR